MNTENHNLQEQKINNNLPWDQGLGIACSVIKKKYKTYEKAKIELEETKKLSKLDSVIKKILELLGQEFKATSINIRKKSKIKTKTLMKPEVGRKHWGHEQCK